MSKQTIVVFGATGKQGGSVANSLLGDSKAASKFHVKAVTRDVTKESAKALAAKGAELVSVCIHCAYGNLSMGKGVTTNNCLLTRPICLIRTPSAPQSRAPGGCLP